MNDFEKIYQLLSAALRALKKSWTDEKMELMVRSLSKHSLSQIATGLNNYVLNNYSDPGYEKIVSYMPDPYSRENKPKKEEPYLKPLDQLPDHPDHAEWMRYYIKYKGMTPAQCMEQMKIIAERAGGPLAKVSRRLTDGKKR